VIALLVEALIAGSALGLVLALFDIGHKGGG
jgi:hypothetical protein